MKLQFSIPVNRTSHTYEFAAGDKLVRSAVSQRANVNVMLARFKVDNIAHGGQTVNLNGHHV